MLDPNSFAGRRPDQIGDPNAGAPHTVNQWFNTAAFANIANGDYHIGTARRGAVRGPGFQRWDMSLFKNNKLTENTSLQFRAEAFNIFNHTNFDTLRTSFSSNTFGKVLTARDARILQLGLKLNF